MTCTGAGFRISQRGPKRRIERAQDVSKSFSVHPDGIN